MMVITILTPDSNFTVTVVLNMSKATITFCIACHRKHSVTAWSGELPRNILYVLMNNYSTTDMRITQDIGELFGKLIQFKYSSYTVLQSLLLTSGTQQVNIVIYFTVSIILCLLFLFEVQFFNVFIVYE